MCLSSVAAAQSTLELGAYHAMPGGVDVATASTLPAGTAVVELSSGVGYRSGLLAEEHRFVRALGEVAAAYGVLDMLTVALSFEGYYDRHNGFMSGDLSGCGPTCESGWVGAPHLYVRLSRPVANMKLGAQLDLWVPGDVAPSMKFDATSVEARALASFPLGPTTLSLDAGFHLDNSANSIDYISSLSVPDRVSFGISNYNAVVAGAHLSYPLQARAWVAAEASFVAFVGGPPAGMADLRQERWLARAGVVGGIQLAASLRAVVFVEAIKSPGVLGSQALAADIPIIPYEPMIVGGFALAYHVSARSSAPPPCWDTPAGCPTDEQPIYSEVSGTIVDQDGTPVPGATVTVSGKTYGSQSSTTSEDGTYTIANVKIGRRLTTQTKTGPKTETKLDEAGLDMRVELAGYELGRSTIASPKQGGVRAPQIAVQKTLPPGQVRGVVRNQRGKPIAGATVSVSPGEHVAQSGADGTFVVDLQPGSYKVKVHAEGFRDQELAVTIDANGVALKEFVLRE